METMYKLSSFLKNTNAEIPSGDRLLNKF